MPQVRSRDEWEEIRDAANRIHGYVCHKMNGEEWAYSASKVLLGKWDKNRGTISYHQWSGYAPGTWIARSDVTRSLINMNEVK